MEKDAIDEILGQWTGERPDLDTDNLGVVIRVLTLNKVFVRQAAIALEPLGLEVFEYDVLSALRRQGKPYELPATSLARETGLSTGAMTNRIDKLENRAMVRRRRDRNDRRAVFVALTAKGRRAIDEAIQLRLNAADECLEGISVKQRKTLATLLRKVILTAGPGDSG